MRTNEPAPAGRAGVAMLPGRVSAGFGGVLASVCLALVLLGMGGLAGCSSGNDEVTESTAAVEEAAPEHEDVTVRVAAPAAMHGVLEELADAYTADKEWLTFDVSVYPSAKKQIAAITPTKPVETDTEAAGDEDASTAAADATASSTSSSTAEEAAQPMLPEADIVFENSSSAMNAAEEVLAADPATRADMLEDHLAIVISADSPVTSVSTADIAAGAYPLAVSTQNSTYAARQYEALAAIGVYADDAFTGYYATAKDSVVECKSTGAVFASVASSDELVAIVRTSDVYRYGGVKVVGAVPAKMYTPMRFPQALGMNLDLLENGEQVGESARDFLSWMISDETALGIIDKWGFYLAS